MGKTWTFGRKVSMGFAIVLILVAAMSTVSWYALETVVEDKDTVIRNTARDVIEAQELRSIIQREVASGRGFLLTSEDRYIGAVRQANTDFFEVLNSIEAREPTAEDRGLIDTIKRTEAAHQVEVDAVLDDRKNERDLGSITARFDDKVVPAFEDLESAVLAYVSHKEDALERERQAASDTASAATATVLAIGGVVFALGVAIAVFLTRSLTRQIGGSVQNIRSSSAELQATASQQASAAKEQATAMNEIGTTVGELLTTSRQISESAQRVASIANDTAESARRGNTDVETARQSVEEIRRQVETIVTHMLGLGKKSQQIGGIVEIITELAEQTNILAINATIEAAGAGDSGRRFAVVGEEIRRLADRVSGSTKEIRELIDEIRAAVNATVMATESGSKTVDAGAARFGELARSFEQIGEVVATTREAAKEIELSTKQQTSAVEQVNVAISNVVQSTKENEVGSKQTLQTAGELASLSDELARLVQPNPA